MIFSRLPTASSSLFLLLLGHFVAETGANDPFLKEILMGRCYDQNPNGMQSSCDEIVGSFMNVLESHTQSDPMLTEALFHKAYVAKTDFAPPKDRAMVWMKMSVGGGDNDSLPTTIPAFRDGGKYWTTPETTPGGRLVEDLDFCAKTVWDNGNNCSRESSNAYWKFWGAAYAGFAGSVQGRLEIVLEDPHVDGGFLHKNLVSHLDATKVTSVRIWGVDCASPIAKTTISALKDEQEIRNVVCKGPDLVELILCSDGEDNEVGDACGTYERGKDQSGGDADGHVAARATINNSVTDAPVADVPTTDTAAATKADTTTAATTTSSTPPVADTDKIHKDGKKKHGHFFVWLFLGILCYLFYKKHYYGTIMNTSDCSSYDKYDCIKGDLLLPGRSIGSSSNGSNSSNYEYNSNNGNGNNYHDSFVYSGESGASGSTTTGSGINSNKSSKFSSFLNGGSVNSGPPTSQ
eukprot:CAMPEP_0168311992 /NCGR_PEP_ID=MMETSP0142_2-20121227/67660_1 /TAXON_ID=44445 /ORGANISM="Pseudo-nitzschia australis, Strain 10249 10 AB" /LENGTH=462 /DNA_ID=CAMNT_0008264923 /DNA_START=254 /DNA_END=1642 /DNA_ORIENTATION=-